MQGYPLWSYETYRPLLWESGEIDVCRLVPRADGFLLEWQGGAPPYRVYVREARAENFAEVGETDGRSFEVGGLAPRTDYAFRVVSAAGKSRVRLLRTEPPPCGTVVQYLHPDDRTYAFSGRCLCSPSLVRLPSGALLASMDLYASGAPQNLTLIYRSDDDGASWHKISELMPCFWGKLFYHRGALYMLACSTEYGDLLIGRSTDEGRTFSAPVALLRGSGGKGGNVGVHKNPQNMLVCRGRLYGTLEWGSWSNPDPTYCHAAMVMSCAEDADLLDPASWHFTPPLPYDPHWAGAEPDGEKGMLEGTLAVTPENELVLFMRYQTEAKKILSFRVPEDPDAPLEYRCAVAFPGNLSKFMIRRDPADGLYYSVVSRRVDEPRTGRNLLSLLSSPDLARWSLVRDLIDCRDEDPGKVGFQYVDFLIEGEDLIFLCRTAYGGAHNFHDANYSTFHRVAGFRAPRRAEE